MFLLHVLASVLLFPWNSPHLFLLPPKPCSFFIVLLECHLPPQTYHMPSQPAMISLNHSKAIYLNQLNSIYLIMSADIVRSLGSSLSTSNCEFFQVFCTLYFPKCSSQYFMDISVSLNTHWKTVYWEISTFELDLPYPNTGKDSEENEECWSGGYKACTRAMRHEYTNAFVLPTWKAGSYILPIIKQFQD
jgi:hypothetical protein